MTDEAKKPEERKAPEPEPGPKWKEFAALAPGVMAELMSDFIERKSLNDRAKIRLMTKALQDFFSADTGYPPVAAIAPGQQRRRPGALGGFGQAGFGAVEALPTAAGGLRMQGEVDRLVGDVEDAVGAQADVLPEVAPAPGAEVAPAPGP